MALDVAIGKGRLILEGINTIHLPLNPAGATRPTNCTDLALEHFDIQSIIEI